MQTEIQASQSEEEKHFASLVSESMYNSLAGCLDQLVLGGEF